MAKSLGCIECGQEMNGIFSHEIRDTCRACGGQAKIERDPQYMRELAEEFGYRLKWMMAP